MSTEPKYPNYNGLIIGALLVVVLVLVIYMAKQSMRLTLLIILPATIITIRIYWKSRKRIWFWAVIVLMLGLHVPVVFVVRWPEQWVPPIGLVPMALADCLIIAGGVHLVEKFIVKPPPGEGEPPPPPFIQIKRRR